jgi:hypothetical protein
MFAGDRNKPCDSPPLGAQHCAREISRPSAAERAFGARLNAPQSFDSGALAPIPLRLPNTACIRRTLRTLLLLMRSCQQRCPDMGSNGMTEARRSRVRPHMRLETSKVPPDPADLLFRTRRLRAHQSAQACRAARSGIVLSGCDALGSRLRLIGCATHRVKLRTASCPLAISKEKKAPRCYPEAPFG